MADLKTFQLKLTIKTQLLYQLICIYTLLVLVPIYAYKYKNAPSFCQL